MRTILIVEDEKDVREGLKLAFADEGYRAFVARSGEESITKFDEVRPDAVLLDVMMPRGNGFYACEAIRARDRMVPIVFYTAVDTTESRLKGLALGADDYVLKTDPTIELFAKVRRAINRLEAFRAGNALSTTLVLGDCTIDFGNLDVSDDSGQIDVLTRTQADILRLLASDRGRYFSSDEILTALRGEGFVCDDNTLSVHIANLRKRLHGAKRFIDSKRRTGYRLLA